MASTRTAAPAVAVNSSLTWKASLHNLTTIRSRSISIRTETTISQTHSARCECDHLYLWLLSRPSPLPCYPISNVSLPSTSPGRSHRRSISSSVSIDISITSISNDMCSELAGQVRARPYCSPALQPERASRLISMKAANDMRPHGVTSSAAVASFA